MFIRYLVALMLVAILPASALADSSYLASLLAATPAGGWVRANTTSYSSAWATGASAAPLTPGGPASVVIAWSSFAWDSTRNDLLLWGGGHANYAGNEMYVWHGDTGVWSRGSLASRLDANNYVVDNAAPQSSHTYDNNVYLPVNDMFLTFGGAAYNSGGIFTSAKGTEGPWLWDPAKADPNKVGGTTGSGYDTTTLGGQMWINRQGQLATSTNLTFTNFVTGTTAYRNENGKDVVYLTADQNASGFPSLYRYAVGDVSSGGKDTFEKVGIMWDSAGYSGAATIDSAHNFYVRSALGGQYGDLAVWDLSKSNAANPNLNPETKVDLQLANGTPFEMNTRYGVDYDAASGKILLWDGESLGKVWSVTPGVDAAGHVLSTWIVSELLSTTSAQPSGSFETGVYGKWKYVSELGAFVALNEYSSVTQDAEVWLYKPFAAAVPEPGVYVMMVAGLGLVGCIARRRRERWSQA